MTTTTATPQPAPAGTTTGPLLSVRDLTMTVPG